MRRTQTIETVKARRQAHQAAGIGSKREVAKPGSHGRRGADG